MSKLGKNVVGFVTHDISAEVAKKKRDLAAIRLRKRENVKREEDEVWAEELIRIAILSGVGR